MALRPGQPRPEDGEDPGATIAVGPRPGGRARIHGAQGQDGHVLAGPWEFSVADITVPVLVMHGRADQFAPFGHAQWLAAHAPGATVRLLDHDGHLTIPRSRIGTLPAACRQLAGKVRAWLAPHFWDMSKQSRFPRSHYSSDMSLSDQSTPLSGELGRLRMARLREPAGQAGEVAGLDRSCR